MKVIIYIILSFLIIAIGIIIWGFATNWKFIKKKKDTFTTNKKTNLEAAQLWAKGGLKEKKNGITESASGSGSSLKAAKTTRELIKYTIKRYNIKSIIDLGCGDWNWMKMIDLTNINYIGYDASSDIININNSKYKKFNIKFKVIDIINNIPEKADLCICRDVLFHLENIYVLEVLKNIKKSGAKYFITTNFLDIKKNNKLNYYGIAANKGWGFRKINLNIEPFNLKKKLITSMLEPKCTWQGNSKRYICLYKF